VAGDTGDTVAGGARWHGNADYRMITVPISAIWLVVVPAIVEPLVEGFT
jgi:hypothetical protein